MTKVVKEFLLDNATGEVSVEYDDNSTSKYNLANAVTATQSAQGVVNPVAGLGGEIYRPPAGLGWAPPVMIYRMGADIKTTFVPDAWKVPSTTVIWASLARGNDTTGDGTFANPYKGLKKALGMVTSDNTTIFVESGVYNRLYGWGGVTPAYNINVIGVGGPVISSAEWEGGAWTSMGNGVYRATRSQVSTFLDYILIDENGDPVTPATVASQVACEAQAHSQYIDGTYIYVHLHDNRAPDANVVAMMAVTNGYCAVDKKYFVQGIEFRGGPLGAFSTLSSAVGVNTQLVFDACQFKYSMANGLTSADVPLTITNRCFVSGNLADGFNYRGTNRVPRFLEIDCGGVALGEATDPDMNDNLTTAHNCIGVRVCTVGFGGYGPVFPDVLGSKTWNIGCGGIGSRAFGANAASQKTIWQAGSDSVQWLDGCWSAGDAAASYIQASGAQYQRACNLPGSTVTFY